MAYIGRRTVTHHYPPIPHLSAKRAYNHYLTRRPTVVVSFTVEKDGSISDVAAAREVAGGCTAAALNAVNAINKEDARFKPGIQGGLPVRVRYNLPVKFSLQ